MRLTDIAIYSNEIEVIKFSLRESNPDERFNVKNIDGLDAENLVPKFYSFGTLTNTRFHEFVLKPRDVVIQLNLNPKFQLNETYSQIRDTIYRAISSSRVGTVDLMFMSGQTTVAKLVGFITKVEAEHFSSEPEVKVTIRCDDPLFRGVNPVRLGPDEIPADGFISIADSASTAPHGFKFNFTIDVIQPYFRIMDGDGEWEFIVYPPTNNFLAGTQIFFCSEPANSYLYMVYNGVTTHLLDRIMPGSVWPMVFPGGSQYAFLDAANFSFDEIEYYTAYWGV
jgi:hypothetical protein